MSTPSLQILARPAFRQLRGGKTISTRQNITIRKGLDVDVYHLAGVEGAVVVWSGQPELPSALRGEIEAHFAKPAAAEQA